MADVLIRRMQAEDIAAVALIEKEAFSVPWSENAFRESLAYEYAMFYVALCGEKIAGYAGMYRVFDEADITNIAVMKQFRRQGIGERLLEKLVAEAETSDIRTLMLEVRKSNSGAIALYEKMGFAEIGIRKNFYEKPNEDALIMCRNI